MQFKPFPLMRGPHQQTILGWVLNFPVKLEARTQTVLLPDNDYVTYEESIPEEWDGTGKTAILLHGLCGSADSPFIVRIAKRLTEMGVRAVRANMRACGSGRPLARGFFHCGKSEDFFPIIKQVKVAYPNSPIHVVGFSLGGNIVLKTAGEYGVEYTDFVDQTIGICPATDILAASRLLALPENAIYQNHFIKLLKEGLEDRYQRFPDIARVPLPDKFSLFEFDQLFTAPQSGFRSALDYYRHASAARVIPNIKGATRVLHASDDPFIDWTALNGLSLPANMKVHLTRYGGHMGYVGHPMARFGYRWMDSVVVDWITNH